MSESLPLPARLVRGVGHAASWLILVMVLITFLVVLLRYGFNLGWIWLQESVTYLHAAVFMLAAAWTWQEDSHVRVDILYRGRSRRHRAWVNLIGTLLFLAPVCVYLLVIGWDYVAASWSLREGSRQAGGLPLVYLLKSLILALPLLLLIQAACEIPGYLRALRRAAEPVSPAAPS
ncbi:MAG: TRAP transporter small permease subunit [Xanthomonadales bacterium]|nr:TRAP transporter small permease subunit [Xanthomonadales bacterium]